MNINDFRLMRDGVIIRALTESDCQYISPLMIKHSDKKHKALLMFHGFGSTPAVFRDMIPLINGYDAIICPLWPGHGTDVTSMKNAKASQWYAAAIDETKRVLDEYEVVDVLGLSLGGLLAFYVGARLPVHHLYLLAPALFTKPPIYPNLKLSRFIQKIGFDYIKNKAGNLKREDAAELAYRLMPIRSLEEILMMIDDFPFEWPVSSMDLFIGRYDEVVDSNKLAKRFFNHANTKIHWLEQSAHVLPLDNDMLYIVNVINESACCSDHSSDK